MITSETTAIPTIEVENLTVSYGPKPALLDVSLSINKGLLVGVIGPNGAGKSTLIKAILGFVKRDVGSVKILGIPAEKAKGLVAYVPQRGAVATSLGMEIPVKRIGGLLIKLWRWCACRSSATAR